MDGRDERIIREEELTAQAADLDFLCESEALSAIGTREGEEGERFRRERGDMRNRRSSGREVRVDGFKENGL